jgi:hypothetical protein
MPASDALFQALAQALSQPSHAYRAAQAGLSIPASYESGYLNQKEFQQKRDQYRMMNTKLGDVFPPGQIPGGLSPDHSVADLKQLVDILPYTRSPVADQIGNELAGNQQGQIASVPSSPPSQPTPPSPSAPAPTIASTSMAPIPGAENPAPPPGSTNLSAIQGAGGGASANLPPGTSPTVPPGPTFKGMSYMDLQRYGPFLNDIRQGRQFQQGQTNENERARLSREQQERNFQEAQQNEKNRTMAGETAKIAPSLTEAGTIQDDINALLPLYKGYAPVPFAGTALANITAKSGSSTFGTPTMQAGKQIQQIVPALSAKVNYLLNKRFNSGEAAMLQQQVVPNASDDEQNAKQKIGNLQRLTAVMQGGDINALKMVASAIAGQPVNPGLPSSGGSAPIQAPSNSTIPPGQIVNVRTSDGVVHKVPAANVGRVKQRDPRAQVM